MDKAESYKAAMVTDMIREIPLGDVLDAGCGTGYLKSALKGWYKSYTGLDIKEGFDLGTMEAPGKYDTIFLVGVLHHLRYWRSSFDMLIRHARPGCRFYVIEPLSSRPMDFIRWMYSKIKKDYDPDQYYFESRELLSFMEMRGLKVISREITGRIIPLRAEIPGMRLLEMILAEKSTRKNGPGRRPE